MTGLIILVIIIVIALLFLTSCIKIVPQAKALVIERLGAYQATWSVGLHFKLPIIERVDHHDHNGHGRQDRSRLGNGQADVLLENVELVAIDA